jgi:restriction endonuclease
MTPVSRNSRRKKSKKPARGKKRGDAYQDAVAAIAKRIDPTAEVEVGLWIPGPDGRRDLDVVVRPLAGGPPVVIECKDWTRPIGIGLIDALESKRRDIGASVAMICSNSGFTDDALRKAARVGIPALAALVEGDKRIRVVVREQIYTRVIQFVSSNGVFHHQPLGQAEQTVLDAAPLYTKEYLYDGRPLEPWLAGKWMTIAATATKSRSMFMKFIFRAPLPVVLRGVDLSVTALEVRADFKVQWMTQVAEIGASSGMYDYLQKRVILGVGPQQRHLKNVDAENWGEPVDIDDIPPRLLAPPAVGMTPAGMSLGLIKGLPGSDPKDAPNLDAFVYAEEIADDPEGAAPNKSDAGR